MNREAADPPPVVASHTSIEPSPGKDKVQDIIDRINSCNDKDELRRMMEERKWIKMRMETQPQDMSEMVQKLMDE